MSDVVVIDYGAGNLRSVVRALAQNGANATVSRDPEVVLGAPAVVLPGVGAAADTMRNLREAGMVDVVREYLRRDRPFLGVCMGLQALLTMSLEGGEHPCLDLLPGVARRLPSGQKVPHMGWNEVWQRREHAVFAGIPDGSHFYFVHSYYADLADPAVIIAEAEYGLRFAAMVARGGLVATQFHPEKSGAVGLRLYANFLALARVTTPA